MPDAPKYIVIAGEQAEINRKLAEMGSDWEPIQMNSSLLSGPRFNMVVTILMKRIVNMN